MRGWHGEMRAADGISVRDAVHAGSRRGTLASVRSTLMSLGLMLALCSCAPSGESVEAVNPPARQPVEAPPTLDRVQAPSPTDMTAQSSPAPEAAGMFDEATSTPEDTAVEAEAEEAADPVRERYCTTSAVRRARSGRGLRCPRCSRYDVVPSSHGRYVSCHCGYQARFSGFVHISRR